MAGLRVLDILEAGASAWTATEVELTSLQREIKTVFRIGVLVKKPTVEVGIE